MPDRVFKTSRDVFALDERAVVDLRGRSLKVSPDADPMNHELEPPMRRGFIGIVGEEKGIG